MDDEKAVRAAPGWYPANDMPGAVRYWDGERWTSHVAPMRQPEPRGLSTMTIARGVAVGIVIAVGGLFFLNSAIEETDYIDCITSDSAAYCEKP